MIDLSNKCFRTKNDTESEKLLRIAVVQGYTLPAGLKSLVKHDCFKFTGFPYRTVSFPKYADEDLLIDYADAFGDEVEELNGIVKRTTQFCREHGYAQIRIYADENDTDYSGSAFAKMHNGGNLKTEVKIPKPRKVTLEEIEQRFGCPIEIVS